MASNALFSSKEGIYQSITFPIAVPSVLACGAWLKNTLCVTRHRQAYISPLIGDLDTPQARIRMEETVFQMCQILGVEPEIVAHDLHPDFTAIYLAYAASRVSLRWPFSIIMRILFICASMESISGHRSALTALGWDGQDVMGVNCLSKGQFARLGHFATSDARRMAAQEPGAWRRYYFN